MSEENKRVAVHVEKTAQDTRFVDCDIQGGALIEGSRTELVRTRINQYIDQNKTGWKSWIAPVLKLIAWVIGLFH